MTRTTRTARGLAVVAAVALTVAGCGGGSSGNGPSANGEGNKPVDGGTLTFLTLQDQLQHLDPQRNYTGEDLAFANGYIQRTLTAYKYSPDGTTSTELTPDLATDTGTASDGAKTWTFTLKDGVTFEDGSPITCADVKYGVSRTFATDIITDGPTYAISMLDIPSDKDGNSVYKGPYVTKGNDTAAFDKAVECPDDKTVVFHLKSPVGDFNYTVTLLSFSPVPKAADTGEKYDDHPVSSGPYKIESYDKGTQLTLVRNENWSKATDDYRGAHPDKIVVKFGLETSVIDQRLIQNSGEDQNALTFGDTIDPANLASVFNSDQYKDRRTNELDPFVRYIAVNVNKVPNLDQRKAIAIALDRAQLRTVAGGAFAGDLADGVIKPNLPKDYAPSGMWDSLLGQKVPDTGDPDGGQGADRRFRRADEDPAVRLPADAGQRPRCGCPGRLAGQGRHQGAAEPDRGRPVLRHRPRPGQGGRPGPRRLGTGLVQRVDRHPGALHADRRLRPLARQRQGLQPEGRRGEGDDRPRRAGRGLEGAEQGGDGQRVGHPDPVRP